MPGVAQGHLILAAADPTSLSQVAKAITGTNWNGHRFFGLRAVTGKGKSSENGSLENGKARPARVAHR
jgi:hypothetical protein